MYEINVWDMQTVKVKLTDIKPNPNNPRIIKDEKFRQLVQSIKDFPAMLELRPIVVNDENVILGGNMRLRACKEAGLKEVPIIKASELTEQQQKEFIIKDNISFGEWDWDILANEWEAEELTEWGLDIPDLDASVKLPDDTQEEKEVFDGFIVVLKIDNLTYPLVQEKIQNICAEHGIEIDIS